MTPEELMRPRYKVIADYPGMSFKIGDTLTYCKTGRDSGWYNESGQSYETCIDFPHLFKKLGWWEERPTEDMPDYVKRIEGGRVYKISDAETKWDFGFTIAYPMTEHDVLYSECLPATEQEYNEYLKSKTP